MWLNRIKVVIWTSWVACVILMAFVYTCGGYKFRRTLAALRHAIRVADANLAESRKLGGAKLIRDDAAAAGHARRELNEVELAALADYLQLTPELPKP